MFTKSYKDSKGMVVPIVLSILAATTLLSLGALALATSDIRISGNFRDDSVAFHAAEAGVERAIMELRDDLEWQDGFEFSSDTKLANQSQYKVEIESLDANRRKITSTGKMGNSVRQIAVVINVDSIFEHALNAGGELILVGKPRISSEGVRANGKVYLDLDSGTPTLNVYTPNPGNVTMEGDTSKVHVYQDDPMDFESVRLTNEQWFEMASKAPEAYYFDEDGVFNSQDTEVTIDNLNCDDIPEDAEGKRTLFVDGDVTFTGEISGVCTIVATGTIKGEGGFVACDCGTWSLIAKGDVLLNFDTEAMSHMKGLVYSEGDYELHGKVKFTGVVTAFGSISAQNPSEFTNNSDPNYWYTYSSAYSVIADPIHIQSWQEILDPDV